MQAALETRTKEELISEIFILQQQLAELRRLIFGAKSERFKSLTDPNQLSLDLQLETSKEEEKPKETETITYTREKSKRKEKPFRQQIPAHIPRVKITLPRPAGTEGWKVIGHEISEELEYQPAVIYAKQSIREKLVDPSNEDNGVKIAQLPSKIITKGIAGAGLLAHILLCKYVDHLPIYRQIQIFRRLKIEFNDSTINGWVAEVSRQMDQLYLTLRKILLQCGYLQSDDTPMLVLERPPAHKKKNFDDNRKRMKGYQWAYHSPELGLVYFDYYPGKEAAAPEGFLKDFIGFLQTDGNSTYQRFDKRADVSLLGCMAHSRRRFEHALTTDRPQAEKMMRAFQRLYAIERLARIQNLTGEERKKFRLEKGAARILSIIRWWCQKNVSVATPQSPLGDAISYFLNQYKYLIRYLEDGRLEIDNNLIENSIRPIALGRKNYLFAGSHDGAKRAAMFYTFFGCCKKHNIDPFQWLRDVLTRLPDHPVNKLEELLPHLWQQKIFDSDFQGPTSGSGKVEHSNN